jgi:predicted esterase
MAQHLHQNQPILTSGEELADARAAMIMIHGRGGAAANILELADELGVPGFVYLAPQAANNIWYPYRFLEPLERNEPYLSSALQAVDDVVAKVMAAHIPPERMILLGFSQGACVALEFAARNAKRYGGVAGLSGGLIGPDDTPRHYPGTFTGTPVFLGCSDVDPHIPKERVHYTAAIFTHMGASVTERLYANMDHAINLDEVEFVRRMMKTLINEV